MSSPPKKPKIVRRTLADGSVREYTYARKAEAQRIVRRNTLKAVIIQFQQSTAWRELASSSQASYRVAFEQMAVLHDSHIGSIKRRHVARLADHYADRPGTAHRVQSALVRLLNFAVERELIPFNPAAGLRKPKLGHHAPWSDEQLAWAMTEAPEQLRRLIVLGLYSAQRVSDLVRMSWAQVQGDSIEVRQVKTGQLVWVPCHRELRAELASWRAEAQGPTILVTSWGKPWRSPNSAAANFNQWKQRHCAEVLEGATLHGLRVTAATKLAEAGCTPHEIMAVTGHTTLAMVEHYTRDAQRRRNAGAAVLKLEGSGKRRKTPSK